MFDFRNLIKKYSTLLVVVEEIGGFYDITDGGKWKPNLRTKEVSAAVFNLSNKDMNGIAVQYGEGGSYTKEDIKIYCYESLSEGAKVTFRANQYTVLTEINREEYAHGLRVYIAKRVGLIKNADLKE